MDALYLQPGHAGPVDYRRNIECWHRRDCPEAGRVECLVQSVWEQIPEADRAILWRAWDRIRQGDGIGPALALVPDLASCSGYCLPSRGIILLNVAWVRGHTDEQVEAVLAHEAAHCLLWAKGADDKPGVKIEQAADAQAESWGFAMQSVRTWDNDCEGPPDLVRYPAAYDQWARDDFRRALQAEAA